MAGAQSSRFPDLQPLATIVPCQYDLGVLPLAIASTEIALPMPTCQRLTPAAQVRTRWSLLLVLLCACSGDELSQCAVLGYPCQAPFVCTEPNDATGSTWSCKTPLGQSPACSAPTLAVPVATTADGRPMHWASTGSCIALTYAPQVSALASSIADAAQRINAVECSQLCFSAPQLSDDTPSLEGAERRVHVTLDDDPFDQWKAVAEVNFELTSGRLVGSLIEINLRHFPVSVFGPGEILNQLAHAVGLGEAADGVESVIRFVPQLDAPSNADLSDADRQTLCVLYGDPPLCDSPR